MYPRTSNPGFYPPDEVIGPQVSRNREAVLQLLEASDCPYEAIGKQAQYCGAAPPATVFSDDFEADRGWTVNASGTDTATLGRFERGDPAQTTSNGVKQLGTTAGGVNDLVTAGWPARRRRARRRRRPDLDALTGDRAAGGQDLAPELLLLPGPRDQLVVERLPAGAARRRHELDGVPGAGRGQQSTTARRRRRASTSRRSPVRPCGSSSRRPTPPPRAWSRRRSTT